MTQSIASQMAPAFDAYCGATDPDAADIAFERALLDCRVIAWTDAIESIVVVAPEGEERSIEVTLESGVVFNVYVDGTIVLA